MRRPLWRQIGLAAVILTLGILVSATPQGRGWEEDFGLTWLFRLRGPVDPPRQVLVVTIDRESADRLDLPRNPRKWPRDLHGRLVDRLAQAGASVIAFDVMFQEPRDAARDRAFADAVRRAGNVILFELLEKEIVPLGAGNVSGSAELIVEKRVPPVRVLADAALGLSPFALPKTPVKVSQAWLFKPEAGGAPTLPLVVLHAHTRAAHRGLFALIESLDPAAGEEILRARSEAGGGGDLGREVRRLRALFLRDPSLAERLTARLQGSETPETSRRDQLAALIFAYGGQNSLYLNFYGPPRTIETIPYYRILGASPGEYDLSGRAVFIGTAARLQPGQLDGFYTTYTQDTGLDVSGVEIAATTFANLLARNPIRPLAPVWELALLVGWGLFLAFALRRFPGGWIPVVALAVGGIYLGGAWVLFVRSNLWMPLVVPLLVQLPVATFGGLLWRYRDVQHERENIRRAFGMHLPISVVDQLARGIDDFTDSTEHAFGICLATDAEQYTTLAERLEPAVLKRLMNDYYGVLFPPVRDRGGVVADVIGDAMLAIWATGGESRESRKRACAAALDILDAVNAFNARTPEYRLPTRLGLHCGELVLGYVGAADHYEYRAVGDIVSTASRIEGLSSQLGTRLLVSADVAAGLSDFRFRDLGRFLLKGKTHPLAICELMGAHERVTGAQDGLCAAFAEGLRVFAAGSWQAALRRFEAIESEHGRDGPSRFYQGLCRRHLAHSPGPEWDGVVKLRRK